MVDFLLLFLVLVLLVLSWQDHKDKEVSSSLLSVLVIVTISLSFFKSLDFENLKAGAILVGTFVILELLTTTLVQEIMSKLLKDESLKNAVLISNGDLPLIFLFGATFGLKTALFGISLVFVLIAFAGLIHKIYITTQKDTNNHNELINIAAIPYFSMVFIMLLVIENLGFLDTVYTVLRETGYKL